MADLALTLLTLAWGTTFLLVNRAVVGTSPGVFLVLRFGIAAAAVGAVVLVRRDRLTPGLVRHGGGLGLFMFAGFALQTIGLRYTTPARSGFLTGMAVLVVPFAARFLLGRRVLWASWLAVALAVAGLLLLTRPLDAEVPADVRLGDLLTAGCALAYALQIVFTTEWSPRHPLAPLTWVQLCVVLAGSALMAAVEPARIRPEAALWATVGYLGLLMTAAAFFVMNWAQRHTTAVRAALIYSLEPLAAALFSHWVGGEPLRPTDWAGGSLIVLAVAAGEVGGALELRRRVAAAESR